ncbi:MAG: hypothetical protein QW228_01155 [Candidatus Aenigmatarchaeota archaeon]
MDVTKIGFLENVWEFIFGKKKKPPPPPPPIPPTPPPFLREFYQALPYFSPAIGALALRGLVGPRLVMPTRLQLLRGMRPTLRYPIWPLLVGGALGTLFVPGVVPGIKRLVKGLFERPTPPEAAPSPPPPPPAVVEPPPAAVAPPPPPAVVAPPPPPPAVVEPPPAAVAPPPPPAAVEPPPPPPPPPAEIALPPGAAPLPSEETLKELEFLAGGPFTPVEGYMTPAPPPPPPTFKQKVLRLLGRGIYGLGTRVRGLGEILERRGILWKGSSMPASSEAARDMLRIIAYPTMGALIARGFTRPTVVIPRGRFEPIRLRYRKLPMLLGATLGALLLPEVQAALILGGLYYPWFRPK